MPLIKAREDPVLVSKANPPLLEVNDLDVIRSSTNFDISFWQT